MKQLNRSDILQLPKRYRANLMSSCSGLKSANLIGSIDKSGNKNLAVFNSVVHLGSHPPMLCFILRPTTVPRNTYDNIKASGDFTVNHIHQDMLPQAHQTSAKYDSSISEFDEVGLEHNFTNQIKSPYVTHSPVKIGCSFKNEYYIEENGCRLIIGEIEELIFDETHQFDNGTLNLESSNSVGTFNLDTYVATTVLQRFDYARPEKQNVNGTSKASST